MLSTVIKQGARRLVLFAVKHAPQILIGVGVVGSVAAPVMAIKATEKMTEDKVKAQADLDRIEEAHKAGASATGEVYSEEDYQNDKKIVQNHLAKQAIKHYWPCVTMELASVIFVLSGARIFRLRNSAMAAAYKGLEEAFNQYRKRVADAEGEDKDALYLYGGKEVPVEITEMGPDGKPRTLKDTFLVPDETALHNALFTRPFTEASSWKWKPDWQSNRYTLERLEKEWTETFRRRKTYVTLHEVLEDLGFYGDFLYTPSGDPNLASKSSVLGWVWDPDSDEVDNYISFGLLKPVNKAVRTGNALNSNFMLEFNCSNIFSKIDDAIMRRRNKAISDRQKGWLPNA